MNKSLTQPNDVDLKRLIADIDGPYLGLMLYGSYARRDHVHDSDIDVLQLVETKQASYQKGPLSVSVYTERQLKLLAEAGNLFVLHLRHEGQILSDVNGSLRRILAAYKEPKDYSELRSNLGLAACILDVTPVTFEDYAGALSRLALYLLRTELYIRCIETGRPAFSMSEVAARLSDERIARCFAGRVSRVGEFNYFFEVRRLCEEYLSVVIENRFGTIEAFAVNTFEDFPFVSKLAFRVLAGDTAIDYQNLFPELVEI